MIFRKVGLRGRANRRPSTCRCVGPGLIRVFSQQRQGGGVVRMLALELRVADAGGQRWSRSCRAAKNARPGSDQSRRPFRCRLFLPLTPPPAAWTSASSLSRETIRCWEKSGIWAQPPIWSGSPGRAITSGTCSSKTRPNTAGLATPVLKACQMQRPPRSPPPKGCDPGLGWGQPCQVRPR